MSAAEFAKIRSAFNELPPKLADRIVKLSLRTGGNYMLKAIKAAAPVKTGRLRKAIKIKNSSINRLKRNGKVGIYITVNKGKSRKDMSGAYYGRFVEQGYNKGSKAVTGRQAVALGVITRDQLNAKRMLVKKKRRVGRIAQGIRYRHGGQSVPGKHFLSNTYNQTKDTAGQMIVQSMAVAAGQVIKELGG